MRHSHVWCCSKFSWHGARRAIESITEQSSFTYQAANGQCRCKSSCSAPALALHSQVLKRRWSRSRAISIASDCKQSGSLFTNTDRLTAHTTCCSLSLTTPHKTAWRSAAGNTNMLRCCLVYSCGPQHALLLPATQPARCSSFSPPVSPAIAGSKSACA